MKRLLKAVWRLTLPIRRPLTAKLEAFLSDCMASALAKHNPTAKLAQDVNLTLDALIAEHDRLQRRVAALQRAVVELQGERERTDPTCG